MAFTVITISNLIWVIYCIVEGVREGFFDHYKNSYKSNTKFSFKKMHLLQRSLVLASTGGIMLYFLGLIAIPFIMGQLLMFYWLHKISYKRTINKIEEKESSYLQEEDVEKQVEDEVEKPLIVLGVALQILIYLIFM